MSAAMVETTIHSTFIFRLPEGWNRRCIEIVLV
jgi:hypothetical protein